MAKKRKKLDQFLQSRKQSHDVALEERARLSNRLFRIVVGIVVVLLLLVLLAVARPLQDRSPLQPKDAVGLGVLLALAVALGSYTLTRLRPHLFPDAAHFNRFILLVSLTALASLGLMILRFPPYLTPLPILAMLITMAYSRVAALFVVLGMGFYLGLLNSDAAPSIGGEPLGDRFMNVQLAVALSLGALVSVVGVLKVRRQSQPAIVGVYCGLVQALIIFSFQILSPEFEFASLKQPEQVKKFVLDPAYGFAGGILCGAIVTTLLPAIELFLGVVTERRLLDLADPSNNLLRVLRERAPGTFQHTLGVQQIARAAAEAIGADELLTDAGTYYHDIGKIYKPEYFVENMGEDKTIHDRLRPSMSKLIIISHVKDGMELAREEKLPQRIIDMIPMHHGTTVVEFFYRKAQRESGEEVDTPGGDVEYRYPGPKPAFREAGILMLADAVEAIAKTITEPTSNRFRDMVRGVIHKRLLDGQLDECNLTMAHLHKIEDSFVKTLTTMYHARIRYPNPPTAGAPTDGSKSEKTGKPRVQSPEFRVQS